MPTGYTYKIGEGQTFEEFAWDCARAFGALIMMRDEPSGAEIPQEFKPGDYYVNSVKEREARLAKLDAMTVEQAHERAIQERSEAVQRNRESREKSDRLRASYLAMLDRVREWEPPSADHVEMKEFMAEQIRGSMKFDCSSYREELPPVDGAKWLASQKEVARDGLDYARKSLAEEIARVDGRNRWLRELRESLACPAKVAR